MLTAGIEHSFVKQFYASFWVLSAKLELSDYTRFAFGKGQIRREHGGGCGWNRGTRWRLWGGIRSESLGCGWIGDEGRGCEVAIGDDVEAVGGIGEHGGGGGEG
ncbi:hypothetical protein PoB_004207700 [Plakobranchus ocellatus]|uniref:Uncharacterized protein n=1 Tax=Plakobranchus ocellatus TaxID=259542 RepID=A0AAV4B8W7_9GAST|nr:hypothetical protein PoB_004207700 [Plakobranchus ocellatus]